MMKSKHLSIDRCTLASSFCCVCLWRFPFLSEPDSLLEEGGGKSFKKVVTTEQDILESIDYPSFQLLSLDAGGVIAGTFRVW